MQDIFQYLTINTNKLAFQKYRLKKGTLLLLLADIVVGLRVVVAHEGGVAGQQDVADNTKRPHVCNA